LIIDYDFVILKKTEMNDKRNTEINKTFSTDNINTFFWPKRKPCQSRQHMIYLCVSVLLPFTDSDYSFGIFKLFFLCWLSLIFSKTYLPFIFYALCDKVCQWLVVGRWCSPVFCNNKIDRHHITEILLKVVLNTITRAQ
jgi:hypothetical protein